ncbi:bifunctional 23S rRNA (guanine(2069)-N(7))-methyltransferase RlmK/23S rRNA (guanine(2445)-N(2))-methyltransferase RlmL [Motiliproteus sediminis]|uniref:bifunctional 23S rRNA (guanine(2069)-N(7))-methyltransferase RlmK/23S rRNA (guanine(2445)-N(2))-methyltransferase RlmL n=1 Tax=Motiliproteus sediminis TaxID=1468178 RepID=UPI001AEFCF28|nr:bifunctional 23S rRNA (guanine(2069)-N(7))-methyltransferase RlmK/23S rRNA (guanine(2445)-N(2))-methyltransferase RlmL [Motiliproteus sediminis]
MTTPTPEHAYFATCPKGLEDLLQQELGRLGCHSSKQTVAGVYFDGDLSVAYRVCLWSRLANRVLMPLVRFELNDADGLYAGVQQVRWLDHLRPSGSLTVDFKGMGRGIRNTHFGALKVKDAIVDQIRDETGQRPSVDKNMPDLRIQVHLHKGKAQVSLDLSGDSLHRRGYRTAGAAAPLKENLAAALLYRCDWPQLAAEGRPFIDPMCGSGTLLVEAAQIALDIAPGLQRRRFGFERWLGHDNQAWQALRAEAAAQRDQALVAGALEIHGYDANPDAVNAARGNIKRSGLERFIRVSQRELAELKPLTHKAELPTGLLLTNPPYGERLSDVPVITYLYQHLGEALKCHFTGWQVGVFTGNPELGKAVGLRAVKQYKLFNGAIPSKLLLFRVEEERVIRSARSDAKPGEGAAVDSMFANRLRKNLRNLDKWARKEGISCYRVYDADMPEYAVAIDRYGDWVHVQEYAAPASVDPVKAMERLQEVMAVVPSVLAVPADHVVLKERRRQSGKSQYQRQDAREQFFDVEEGAARLLVNLHDYLDTGLFLDHRPIRLWLGQNSGGKRFLNLFSYTAAATVHAALGGARSSVSVDLSHTYLEWARKNFALNGLGDKLHQTVQADVLRWLQTESGQFDLIFMDPPSFSNSKRMQGVLDVQRDHVALIEGAMALLASGGLLVFSNNLRRFKLDYDALAAFDITDVTPRTLDKDFARNSRIHQCWEIRHPD